MPTMKEIPGDFRPYEKVLKNGPGCLDDSELLAVILRTGTRGKSSVDVARSVIAAGSGTISGIRRLTLSELRKIPGIGTVKAIQIQCLCTLFVRFSGAYFSETENYSSAEWVASRYMEELRAEPQEIVRVLYLNAANGLIAGENLAKGSADRSVFPVREMLVGAFKHNAVGLLVIHNHPGGNPEPSPEDISATRVLSEAAELSGIRLLDHLILGDRKYTSLRELGIIK